MTLSSPGEQDVFDRFVEAGRSDVVCFFFLIIIISSHAL